MIPRCINFFGHGHHAKERYGVKTLGDYLADEFDRLLIIRFKDLMRFPVSSLNE